MSSAKPLSASGLLASMGRVGSAFDNAMAESVFATLKTEQIYHPAWPSRDELEWRSSPASKASTTPDAGTPG